MLKRTDARSKRSPAMLVALVALFVALGGSAVATTHYLITNTHQIKPSVLRALHGRSGPQGEQGEAGPQGPAGPVSLSALIEITSAETPVAPESVGGAEATCPAGQHAVSGGGFALFGRGGLNLTKMSEDHLSWFVLGINEGVIEGKITAYVNCATAGTAVAASSNTRAHARAVAQMKRAASRLEALRAK